MNEAAGVIILIGRILFVIFPAVISGYAFHFKNPEAAKGYAQSVGFPVPALAAYPSAFWLIASSLSIALGIWPDIGALMLAVFVVLAGWYFHRYWEVDEPNQKQAQTMFFYRNVMIFSACLIMFGFFAALGDDLPYSITGPLIDLSSSVGRAPP